MRESVSNEGEVCIGRTYWSLRYDVPRHSHQAVPLSSKVSETRLVSYMTTYL